MKRIARNVSRSSSSDWLVPTFLCPTLHASRTPFATFGFSKSRKIQCRGQHTEATQASATGRPTHGVSRVLLPWTCPGCGAYTQSETPDEAGFYSQTRKPVKRYLARQAQLAGDESLEALAGDGTRNIQDVIQTSRSPEQLQQQDQVLTGEVEKHDPREEEAVSTEAQHLDHLSPVPQPVCDRCHNLEHHGAGQSIDHPTMTSIQDMLADSPYKDNHVYHVIDAADFPLSLIPRLQRHLSLAPQRSSNRRAQHKTFYRGNRTDMSFVITRSDLLAPQKSQVDAMMPYLVDVLRNALGSMGDGIRLGNVKCVSSYRGWWTKQLKEEVWERGGGQWMVGKVNVGKSHLLENIFPKNRAQDVATIEEYAKNKRREASQGGQDSVLLPPQPEETAFPVMPRVSHLPGTTASPIRLPFGRGKGELIDLPGLHRGNLEHHVLQEHQGDLVMRNRERAKQFSIKPGQSLVVSNLFRITPKTPGLVFLACPFIPLECHVTNTEKAQEILAQNNFTSVKCIAKPEVKDTIERAGRYFLETDVTKARAGPLTRKDAVGLKAERLPFVVYSTDILIEGVGWIELAAQVRRSALEGKVLDGDGEEASDPMGLPEVEVFSPYGEHVGVRKPLGAWMLGGKMKKPVSQRTQRPRRSMKGVKKAMKKESRQLQAILRESGKGTDA